MNFAVSGYWFYAMYANTSADAGDGSELWRDFRDYAGLDTSEKNVEMNAASWFDPSKTGGTANSYFQAYVALTEDALGLDAAATLVVASGLNVAGLIGGRPAEVAIGRHGLAAQLAAVDDKLHLGAVAVGPDVDRLTLVA